MTEPFESTDSFEHTEPSTGKIAIPQTSAAAAVVVAPPRPGPPEPVDTAGSGGTGGTGGDGVGTDSGDAYTVDGTVSSPVSPSVGTLTVQLLDYNVGAPEPTTLATTSTANDGSYAFNQVVIATGYLQQHHKASPDLQVQVSAAGGTILAASPVEYSAPTTLKVNVVLPPTASGLPSEYEQLTANLGTVYTGSLADLKEDATQQDITYLANKTGWDARAVAMAAIATQFSQTTAPTPTPAPPKPAPAPAGSPTGAGQQQTTASTASVPPEFFYALLRAGLPTDADGLFSANSAQLQAIWQQAVTNNVIPQTLQSQIPAAVSGFAAQAGTHLLTAAPTAGVSTLQEMVAPTLPDAAHQQQFAQLYAQYQGDWDSLWPAVSQALGSTTASKLQLTGQLHFLTINNAPLVAALNQANSSITSPLDLVPGGYYTPEKWTSLIGTTAVPSQVPGSTQPEQAANYAQYLATQVRLAYPTAVLADQVKKNAIPVAGTAELANNVAAFLNTHQSDFQIGAEPVDAYVNRTGLTIDPDVRTQVKSLQRAYQLTPDDNSMAVLLQHKLDSAYALTHYDTAGFVRTFASKLGGEDTATAIHQRAKQIFSASLNVAVSYLKARRGTTIGAAAAPIMQSFPPQTDGSGTQPPAYATLEDLFGSMDYCGCSDCSSILSPAAYLVDLLNYLDQPAPTRGDNPQDVLLARRPDLQYLPLTCANTNTAMPYIDLVNETLEYLVASDLKIDGYQGHDTADTITSAELIASPQYVNDAAYTRLQQVFFPTLLPFNRPLTLLRAHLQNLGMSLPAAMTTLRVNDNLTNTTTLTSYGWRDILIEQLGVSRDEFRLFTDPTLQLGDLYGLSNSTALATLQTMNLQDFSRRVNVSYVDLITIIQTQFVNPNAALIPRLQLLNTTFATLQQLHENQSTTTQFESSLPAGLDCSQYRTSSNSGNPADAQTVVDWVNNKYAQIMDLIVIDDFDADLGDCSGTNLALRYANPASTASQLSSTDLLKIIRFIRLWSKLTPLLGDPDDAVTIEQTDDIIAALYPATDQPTSSNADAQNRTLLDNGFATLLSRAGFAFEALNLLSLNADQGLAQLLACWAPIQTYGPNALYRQMFLTPTLLQQDPGPPTATVAPSVSVGDQLNTFINGVGPTTIPAYTVSAADTTSTGDSATPMSTATKVAANIAASINACTATNPAWGGVALNSRFHATTSQQNVITIVAGLDIQCTTSNGATETYGPVTGSPVSLSAPVAGTPRAGDIVTTTIDGVEIDYTVVAADTPATIAANIAAAVNTTSTPDPYGPPLNQLVYAEAAGATVNFVLMGAGAPFTLTCEDIPASASSYTASEPTPARRTATIPAAKTVKQGDVFTTVINDVSVTYTAASGDTPTTAANSIAEVINGCVQADSRTGLALNLEVRASAADGVVTITPTDPSDPITLKCSTTGTATYTAAGPFPEQVGALISSPPPGATLTTTINGLPVKYRVQPGDTGQKIATNIANLINATTTDDPVTNQPLNKIVTAAAAPNGAVAAEYDLTVTALSPTTPFTFEVTLTCGGYTAGRGRAPFVDDGYGGYLTDPTQTLFAHEAALCAACNINGAEFGAITGAAPGLGYTAVTPLSLETVSAVFRRAWLPQALGISVLEFLQLRAFTGIDPFTTPDPGNGPAPMIAFIQLIQALTNAGVIPAQALYLMWNQDNAGTYTPPPSVITGLAAALVADFAAVETGFALPPGGDPDGSIAKNLMTLVYGTATTDTFFGLLNNTFTTSIPYSVPPGQNALSAAVVNAGAAPSGQLSYDNMARQLSYAGVLTAATQAAIDAAIVNTTDNTTVAAGAGATFTPASMSNISPGTVLVIDTGSNQESVTVLTTIATTFTADTANAHPAPGATGQFPITTDPNLTAGIEALASANQQAVNQLFAAYPELQPLYSNYVTSMQPVQDKRTALLQQFLPVLKTARKSQQALTTAASAAGVDPSFATALLQDPTVLHTDTDPTAAAVNDMTAIENQGLTAEFFLDNKPSGAPDQTIDPKPPALTATRIAPLSYAQTATVAGTLTVGDTLHTKINGVDITYTVQGTDTTTTVLAASIATAIRACTTLVPTSTGNLPMNQVVTASSDGPVITISGSNPSGANGVFALTTSVTSSASATDTYTAGTQLPTGSTANGVAAIWSGYLTVAQNGNYDINIAADEGVEITLQINGATIPGAISGALWANSAQIALTAGSLIPITLTATSIKTTFAVSWTSQGLGWQPIPTANLYPLDYVTQLGNTYSRFLKAASLASALSLTANETSYLGTTPGYAVNTTCTSTVNPGAMPATFTPASITNITVGSVLLIDSGTNMETVTVTAVNPQGTPPTFSATVTKSHDGSPTPFSLVSQANPAVGRGWLNFFAPQGNPGQATAASLASVLTALLDYARIKQALSPADERLLAVLSDPTADVPGLPHQNALLSLTGWSLPSLNALLTHFFPGAGQFPAAAATATVLSPVENFRRIYDAYTLVNSSGLAAASLVAAITNAPSETTVAVLQSALRAQYAESDWLTLVGPINDTARTQQRDALVAYIVQQLGGAYASEQSKTILETTARAGTGASTLTFADTSKLTVEMPVSAGKYIAHGTTVGSVNSATTLTLSAGVLASIPKGTKITFAPADRIPVVDADGLYDLLLVDTQTQPPVLTSRIRLALSMVQLFIERVIRNLEPHCAAADIDTAQWSWMKTYRVWQANREVFLWPENWADPQLRDDPSPFFQQMMTGLLQGDITDDAAKSGYLNYLTSLEEVAKLEPCGIFYLPGSADTDETSYVIARTAGGRRKYYVREFTGGAWTSWAEVNIDCEDNPLIPVVWNGRLFLFWLKAQKHSAKPTPPAIDKGDNTKKPWTLAEFPVSRLQESMKSSANSAGSNTVTASAALCWAEYYNRAWQPTKTSDVNSPTALGDGTGALKTYDSSGTDSFDVQRGRYRLVPLQFPSPNTFEKTCQSIPVSASKTVSPAVFPADSIVLAIVDSETSILGGFMLHNTHSLPIRLEDIIDPTTRKPLASVLATLLAYMPHGQFQKEGYGPSRRFPQAQLYTGGIVDKTPFTMAYGPNGSTTVPGGAHSLSYSMKPLRYSWMPRWVDTQPLLRDSWDAPFLYEDRQAQFYVTTTITTGFSWFTGFGIPKLADGFTAHGGIPPLSLVKAHINTTLSAREPVMYQGRLITQDASSDERLTAKVASTNGR